MRYMTRWFIDNPVAANLLMALILVAGLFTAYSIRIEGFPKLPADTIVVETVFVDASAVQVDEHITQKIEDVLEGLQGVRSIQSTSIDGLSIVHVRKNYGYDLQRLLDDLRVRMDGVNSLPRLADSPKITRNEFDFPALFIQLHGDLDPGTLQILSRRLKENLLADPEVSRLNVWGLDKPEIRIEVRPESLEKYDITIGDITEKIQSASLPFKDGLLKSKDGSISIRVDSQAYYQQEFANIPLKERVSGGHLRLSDIATIRDDFEDSEVVVRFNGQAAVGMEILIARTENLLNISQSVKRIVANFRQNLPDNVQVSIWGDSSHYIAERLRLLKNNALQGLFLVVFVLALFLNVKLAFWVALGIPVSVAGALAVMGTSWVDYSLNDVTTFGLIIALGILVDDAVVVGESVFEQKKIIDDPKIATEQGVHRVAAATTFGVLTTVAALLPMLLIDNALGKVLASFSGVAIFAMLFSLLESKLILPSHLAALKLCESPSPKKTSHSVYVIEQWTKLQRFAQSSLQRVKNDIYRPLLIHSLRQRYVTVTVFVSLAVVGLTLMNYGKIKTVFFPDIPGQVINIGLEMDARAPYRLITENTRAIESVATQLNDLFRAENSLTEDPIRHVLVVINSAFSAEIYAELSPIAQRDGPGLNTLDILKRWQRQTGVLEGVTELTFSAAEDMGGGFDLQLIAENEELLRQASQAVLIELRATSGVSNVRDSLKHGKPAINLVLKPEAKHLGVSAEQLATQIGYRYGGAEVQRLQRDNSEVKVIVKGARERGEQLSDLLSARIRNSEGQWIPLSSVAKFESHYVSDYVSRYNGKRVNNIRASIDKAVTAPSVVAQELQSSVLSGFQQRFPSVTSRFSGELEQAVEVKGGLVRALLFTCILIYALLAIPLKSYTQPLIIIAVVPFGFIGAAIGHLVMDLPFSILSFFGMLALTGIVVNDSLVMMTRYNQARQDGLSNQEALIDSGVSRFQAIFLTTLTTVVGLVPLIHETSEQAQYLIPAAVSLVYGEIFATAITLILVPVLIAISADAKAGLDKIWHKRKSAVSNNKIMPAIGKREDTL